MGPQRAPEPPAHWARDTSIRSGQGLRKAACVERREAAWPGLARRVGGLAENWIAG